MTNDEARMTNEVLWKILLVIPAFDIRHFLYGARSVAAAARLAVNQEARVRLPSGTP